MAGFSVINGVALRNYATAKVYEKLVQGILHVNGKGVNEAFVQGQLGNRSISIPHVALGDGSFRELGADVNGAGFNENAAISAASDYIEVPLMYVYDRTETLPRIFNDKAGYDLLNQKLENITRKITRGINALTFAVQFSTAINEANEANSEDGRITRYNPDTDKVLDAYIAANTNLDNGEEKYDLDFFPTENRQAFLRPSFYASLLKSDGKVILNSNLGQEMLATGVLNPFKNSDASKVEMRDGYCGEVAGVPMYKVSPILWKLAGKFCKVGADEATDTLFDNVEAMVCSSWGTIRGFSAAENIEVIPAIQGQGWIMQPLVHGGCKCISGKSCQLIVNNSFTLPEGELTILPPESRAS